MTRPRILLTRRWPAQVEVHLAQRYDVQCNLEDQPMDEAALVAAMRSSDALCPTVTDALTARILETPGARVRLVANYGVGYQHVDLEACQRAGIVLANTPGILTHATAELALTLLLMCARRTGAGERLARSGNWQGFAPTQLLGTDVRGRTLGLVGFGRVGRELASLARRTFDMQILYTDVARAAATDERALEARYVPQLEELLRAADVVSLHCPGGAATHHLLNATRLAYLKPDAILINTSRGTVVDEKALAAALTNGRLGAAGLDVYEAEPVIDPALLKLDNVVLLPHLGSATMSTRIAMGMRVAANLDAFFAGAAPPDRVA